MSASDVAISVRGLSKAYTIRHDGLKRPSFREVVVEKIKHPFRKAKTETFWALNDVSFDIKRGDVVGIIGRNGAGKSTLLKILSRIVEPSHGEVDMYGRVGSLLEVGTGFHPELTGRENIYLNGAILGMRRAEIKKQFDAIVDFAEVERFLDTPVKRYSSGMYVRLAFAVAAHLNPEILIVDEVLAVGDLQFQRKCLGKMHDVAKGGRTVLFVSHNMQAIKSLCNKGIYLTRGLLTNHGTIESVLHSYVRTGPTLQTEARFSEKELGEHDCYLVSIKVFSGSSTQSCEFSTRDPLIVELEFVVNTPMNNMCIGFDLLTEEGAVVFRSYQTDLDDQLQFQPRVGRNRWNCTIPAGLLTARRYGIAPRISIHNVRWIVNTDAVISFELSLDHSTSQFWRGLNESNRPGVISPVCGWAAHSTQPTQY